LRAAATRLAAWGGAALLGLAAVLPAGASARTANLVTPAEAAASAKAFAAHPEAQDLSAAAHSYLGDTAQAPTIDVLTPKAGLPAKPPFDVRVVARPPEGLGIDRSSIRIRYGFFKIDITKRMLALGRWEGNEFIVHQAKAPAGTHLFYVTVADTAHHQATVSLRVVIL
jgi:hypothetical protein